MSDMICAGVQPRPQLNQHCLLAERDHPSSQLARSPKRPPTMLSLHIPSPPPISSVVSIVDCDDDN